MSCPTLGRQQTHSAVVSVCLDLCVEGPGHCLFFCFLCVCSSTGVLKLYPSVRRTAFVHLCRCFTVSGLFSARQLQLD